MLPDNILKALCAAVGLAFIWRALALAKALSALVTHTMEA